MTKGDKIVAIVIVVFSLVLFIVVNSTQSNTGRNYISIQINGEEIEKITLGQREKKEYKYSTDFGENHVEVDGERVRMVHSSCKDQICVHQGVIQNSGEIIICLPNRFVVEIKNEGKNEIDVINY